MPRNSLTAKPAESVRIIEAENDFPFASINYLRVGSAHTVCAPSEDEENIDLMLRISTHIMSRYEPELLPAQVIVEYKTDASTELHGRDLLTRAAATIATPSASKFFEPSFVDRQWLKGLYLCVLVQGQLPIGFNGYCYFGVFAETLIDFVDRYQPEQPFNPTQLKAIVLARSTGDPSIEIREFMRMKFSFDREVAILEISHS